MSVLNRDHFMNLFPESDANAQGGLKKADGRAKDGLWWAWNRRKAQIEDRAK